MSIRKREGIWVYLGWDRIRDEYLWIRITRRHRRGRRGKGEGFRCLGKWLVVVKGQEASRRETSCPHNAFHGSTCSLPCQENKVKGMNDHQHEERKGEGGGWRMDTNLSSQMTRRDSPCRSRSIG